MFRSAGSVIFPKGVSAMEYLSACGSFLNEARLLSGGAAETAAGGLAGAGLSRGSFGLSSGAGLSAFVASGGVSSAHSLCLLARLVSRGGVWLSGAGATLLLRF